jgi:methylenetetrahydrofolate reductase (NADPH)
VTAPVAWDYGFSLADSSGTAGPDRFIRALTAGYDPRLHGEVTLRFDPFGGIAALAAWISEYQGTADRLPEIIAAPSQSLRTG